MKATIKSIDKGNFAMQMDIVTIPLTMAAELVKVLDVRPGTYWESNLLKPMRRAKRAKLDAVKVYTAGFGTSDLVNAVYQIEGEIVGE